MLLLDRAVKLAAEQDESDDMNFVRKHAKAQASELPACECQRRCLQSLQRGISHAPT